MNPHRRCRAASRRRRDPHPIPAILEYLDEAYPTPLLPADPLARAKVRAIAALIACDITPSTIRGARLSQGPARAGRPRSTPGCGTGRLRPRLRRAARRTRPFSFGPRRRSPISASAAALQRAPLRRAAGVLPPAPRVEAACTSFRRSGTPRPAFSPSPPEQRLRPERSVDRRKATSERRLRFRLEPGSRPANQGGRGEAGCGPTRGPPRPWRGRTLRPSSNACFKFLKGRTGASGWPTAKLPLCNTAPKSLKLAPMR